MPPTGLMLSTHTLAHEIVTRDKNEVFEDRYLDLLERFVVDPDNRKQEMMGEFGWEDEGGDRPGMYTKCVIEWEVKLKQHAWNVAHCAVINIPS